ncbi:MAG: hypothetical protein H7257_14275 [Taibaiella sp.]|nr:hypothetical protein [Taibaiella sp.]
MTNDSLHNPENDLIATTAAVSAKSELRWLLFRSVKGKQSPNEHSLINITSTNT